MGESVGTKHFRHSRQLISEPIFALPTIQEPFTLMPEWQPGHTADFLSQKYTGRERTVAYTLCQLSGAERLERY